MWREGDALDLLNIRCNQMREKCQNICIELEELELMMVMVMVVMQRDDSFLI